MCKLPPKCAPWRSSHHLYLDVIVWTADLALTHSTTTTTSYLRRVGLHTQSPVPLYTVIFISTMNLLITHPHQSRQQDTSSPNDEHVKLFYHFSSLCSFLLLSYIVRPRKDRMCMWIKSFQYVRLGPMGLCGSVSDSPDFRHLPWSALSLAEVPIMNKGQYCSQIKAYWAFYTTILTNVLPDVPSVLWNYNLG